MTNNKIVISLILGGMCLLLAYGITIQIKTTTSTGSITSTNATENELRDTVLKSKEKYDNLYRDLENAEKKLEEERNKATQNNSELENLENQIKEENKILGLTEVTGDGIKIELDDNKTIPSSNYLGDISDLVVHDIDVIRVINEIKNAGAEAISINGQRIVSTTAIECDGNVIKVNGIKIGTPFKIRAIGNPEWLYGSLNRKRGYLEVMREDYFLVAKVEKAEKLTIPKYTGIIKYEYAESK